MIYEECLHYEACREMFTPDDITDSFEDAISCEFCTLFKNKADFVEVVRCKDCRYLLKDTMICSNKNNMTSINKRVYYGHFCSYGERE